MGGGWGGGADFWNFMVSLFLFCGLFLRGVTCHTIPLPNINFVSFNWFVSISCRKHILLN